MAQEENLYRITILLLSVRWLVDVIRPFVQTINEFLIVFYRFIS